jgi:ubiquinone/menaquinone biosynthesis C-methylase UbiE
MNRDLSYFDIAEAKKAYAEGKNITELLRAQKQIVQNTPEIIEIAYDLQAGTYVEFANNQSDKMSLHTTELAQILDKHISFQDTLLDIGTGELTTLSFLISALTNKPKKVYAFDISWSRIFKGISFAKDKMGNEFNRIKPFVADMSEIPLLDKSINITTSSHALEPNGGKLKEILMELFRVTIDKLVLFEPCYEINTQDGKDRMDKLGYIKNMEGVISELGGKLIDKIGIKTSDLIGHPLNPTVCYIIEPPQTFIELAPLTESKFTVPGTSFSLHQVDSYYVSSKIGLCYPILKNIPILKSNCSILATALTD